MVSFKNMISLLRSIIKFTLKPLATTNKTLNPFLLTVSFLIVVPIFTVPIGYPEYFLELFIIKLIP